MIAKTITCPNCKANININWSHGMTSCFCNYCGTQLYFDDGSYTANYNITYRETDDARIREADVNERIRMKEMEFEHQEKKSSNRMLYFILTISLLCMFLPMIFSFYHMHKEEEINKDKIKMPNSYSHYTGENYEVVIEELKALGFENIETYPLGDLKIGLLKKENDVDKISINGNDEFRSNDYFEDNAVIKIYFHSYPEDSSESN